MNRPDEIEEFCIFNRNQNACNYAVGMGTLAFLSCAAFLALDVYFPQISSVKDRKKAVLADIGVSGKLWGVVSPRHRSRNSLTLTITMVNAKLNTDLNCEHTSPHTGRMLVWVYAIFDWGKGEVLVCSLTAKTGCFS